MKHYLIPTLFAAILLGSGVAHGLRTDRWSPLSAAQVAKAGENLKGFPLQVGDWQGVATPWAEVEAVERAETTITRRYVNRTNGDAVGVLLSCGHTWGVSQFHTPLECYPANGYTLVGTTRETTVKLRDESECRFNVSDFKTGEGPLARYVRVFWAWTGDGAWTVSEQPRFALGRYRVLYKLYATRPITTPDEPIESDPCVEFIRDVIPVFSEVSFPRPNSQPLAQ